MEARYKKVLLGVGIAIVLSLLIASNVILYNYNQELDQEIQELDQEIQELEQGQQELEGDLQYLLEEHGEKLEQMRKDLENINEFFEEWELDEWSATMYAPLDPNAVEGHSYSGDPNITASGAEVEIGRTAAAGPNIPFGTKVLIEGIGMRVVQDRGGVIGDGDIDIASPSREKNAEFGRQNVRVMYHKGE